MCGWRWVYEVSFFYTPWNLKWVCQRCIKNLEYVCDIATRWGSEWGDVLQHCLSTIKKSTAGLTQKSRLPTTKCSVCQLRVCQGYHTLLVDQLLLLFLLSHAWLDLMLLSPKRTFFHCWKQTTPHQLQLEKPAHFERNNRNNCTLPSLQKLMTSNV
jgi:hypothetical protein